MKGPEQGAVTTVRPRPHLLSLSLSAFSFLSHLRRDIVKVRPHRHRPFRRSSVLFVGVTPGNHGGATVRLGWSQDGRRNISAGDEDAGRPRAGQFSAAREPA